MPWLAGSRSDDAIARCPFLFTCRAFVFASSPTTA
jgi:hypothetical protein